MTTNNRTVVEHNDDGTWQIKVQRTGPGVESLAGVAAPMDLSLDGNSFGADGFAEVGASGLIVAASYRGLLCFLDLEPVVKSGAMSRKDQLTAALKAAKDISPNTLVALIVVAAVLAILPGLAPVVAGLGLLGGGVMAVRLTRAFHRALTNEQRDALQAAASKAGIQMPWQDSTKPMPGVTVMFQDAPEEQGMAAQVSAWFNNRKPSGGMAFDGDVSL